MKNGWKTTTLGEAFTTETGYHASKERCGLIWRFHAACARAKMAIATNFSSKQQEFVNFVLAHYVGVGVDELDQEKLTPLLRLRYRNSIADAIADLGRAEEISRVFVGFQKYLYQPTV